MSRDKITSSMKNSPLFYFFFHLLHTSIQLSLRYINAVNIVHYKVIFSLCPCSQHSVWTFLGPENYLITKVPPTDYIKTICNAFEEFYLQQLLQIIYGCCRLSVFTPFLSSFACLSCINLKLQNLKLKLSNLEAVDV